MPSAASRAVTAPEHHDALGDPSLVSWLHGVRAGDHDWEDAVQTALVELLERQGPGRSTRGFVLRRCSSRYVDLCRRSTRRGEVPLTNELTAPVPEERWLPCQMVLKRIIIGITSSPADWGLGPLEAQTTQVVLSTKCRDTRGLALHLRVSKWAAKRRMEKAVCTIRNWGQGK